MPTRVELQDISRLRLQEAEALYAARLYDGCAYLCGYVVESALKACICRTLDVSQYLDAHKNLGKTFRSHDFDDLSTLAGFKTQIQANRKLWLNWNIATAWRPEQRYEPPGRYLEPDALALLNSIRDNPDGVLTWLSQRW